LFLQSRHETKEDRTFLRALGGRLTIEIPSNMEQRQKWFEAFETFCDKQIYADNDKDNF
jgi:hypothetical protein